jgi:hypothetical protein
VLPSARAFNQASDKRGAEKHAEGMIPHPDVGWRRRFSGEKRPFKNQQLPFSGLYAISSALP